RNRGTFRPHRRGDGLLRCVKTRLALGRVLINSVYARFAPKAAEILSCREMLRCARNRITIKQQIYLNTSTVANGSADHGRKRFKVNFVFCPGWTSTSR